MERALKALVTAQGRRVKHRHDLGRLWDEAEKDDERIRAVRDPRGLDRLSRYAGDWRYALPSDIDPEADWRSNRTTGEDLLAHAQHRVPQLVRRTIARIEATRAESPDETPGRGECRGRSHGDSTWN